MRKSICSGNFCKYVCVLQLIFLQPQPQYRQVFGVQQPMVGPRGQIATRPAIAPGNTQNQQFDDVTNYDFLG